MKGDVHDIGKNIVGVVLACNNYEIIDIGVMIPARKILDEAKKHQVDIIGLSGLITPSLDEMSFVASEMQREGFDIPLLIGGATTSRVHTAVKIAPNYPANVAVHVNDASRAVGVVQGLLGADKAERVAKIRADYAHVAEAHAKAESAKQRVTLAQARGNIERIDWSAYAPPKPTFTGTRILSLIDMKELIPYIDWTPFFHSWELKGRYPKILEDEKQGEAARALFADAQKMLKRIVDEHWFTPKAILGFWPANSIGDDIALYTGESRAEKLATFYTLRQQLARPDGKPNYALADFVAPEGGKPDYVGAFVVTAGPEEKRIAEKFVQKNDDYDSILVKAIADRVAEAAAEYLHTRVRKEFWGYAPDERVNLDDLIHDKYQGIRPAPGYPAQPDHTEKQTIFDLLGATKNLRRDAHGEFRDDAEFIGVRPLSVASPGALFRRRQGRARPGRGLRRSAREWMSPMSSIGWRRCSTISAAPSKPDCGRRQPDRTLAQKISPLAARPSTSRKLSSSAGSASCRPQWSKCTRESSGRRGRHPALCNSGRG